MKQIPKPKHLGPEYADQFKDPSVAEAYANRPPYANQVFSVLDGLISGGPRTVLDIGSGTGAIAIPIANRVDQVDAVDPSEAMVNIGRSRPGGDQSNIRWVVQSAEEFPYPPACGLIVAGASLHWMDWYTVIPKMARALSPQGYLAVVGGRRVDAPWQTDLNTLIPRYSTNQDFAPYDLIDELEQRGLFSVVGRHVTEPRSFSQSVEEYVEGFHSMNGFSRQRMDPAAAAEFDSGVRSAVAPYASNGRVQFDLSTDTVWGHPLVPA